MKRLRIKLDRKPLDIVCVDPNITGAKALANEKVLKIKAAHGQFTHSVLSF